MNQTDSTRLSGALFDDVMVPLADARRAAGAAPYFPLAPDPVVSSYFVPAEHTAMTPADFDFPGGGSAEGLIDALVTYWRAQGEHALADAAPRLKAVANALHDEAALDDGTVDIFCYTLF